jgi:hypothetical protein
VNSTLIPSAADPWTEITPRLPGFRATGDGRGKALCILHDDHKPSVDVKRADNGNLLLYCPVCGEHFDAKRYMEKLGLPAAGLFASPFDKCETPPARKQTSGKKKKSKRIHPTPAAALDACRWALEQSDADGRKWQLVDEARRFPGGTLYEQRAEPVGATDGDKKFCVAGLVPGGYIAGDAHLTKLPLYIGGGADTLPPGDTLDIHEGAKKADIGNAVGRPSVAPAHGANSPHRSDWTVCRGRRVAVCIDNDDPGRRFGRAVAGLAFMAGAASVRIVTLTPDITAGDIVDLAERFKSDTAALSTAIGAAVNAAQPEKAEDHQPATATQTEPSAAAADETAGQPTIIVRHRQLPEITAEEISALAAANDPPVVFTRGGAPVSIRLAEDGRCIIAAMNETAMRSRLARVARHVVIDIRRRKVAVAPPMDVVRDLLAQDLPQHRREDGRLSFPPLEAITATPVLRPDGTILDSAGYDASTRLYYAPPQTQTVPPVSARPTPDEIREALGLIDQAVGEFPYESEADRANAIATLLTPSIRQAIDGKSPLAIVDAPQAGTGKSLLVEAIGMIAAGDFPAMMGAPSEDAEWRKQITATLLNGPTVIAIDNIDAPLTSPSLARALTANVWSDRRLGASDQLQLLNRATWLATGNNVEIGGDLPRRCYVTRLDAKTARPWRGRTFRHPDLLRWIGANRGRLVWACLTLCRAWHVAGRPVPIDATVIGSFEDWSRTLSGILHVAGVTGFLTNLDSLYEQADEGGGAGGWESFLRAWRDRFGSDSKSAGQIIEELEAETGAAMREAMPDTLAGFVVLQPAGYMQGARFTIRDAGRFKIKMGKALRERIGRRYGDDGLHLERHEDSHSKSALWSVCGECPEFTPRKNGTPRSHSPQTNDGNGKHLPETAGSAGSVSTFGARAIAHTPAHGRAGAHGLGASHSPQLPALPANEDSAGPDAYEAQERLAIQSEGKE